MGFDDSGPVLQAIEESAGLAGLRQCLVGRWDNVKNCGYALGITQRIGDSRKMRKDYVPILGAASVPPRPAPKAQRDS